MATTGTELHLILPLVKASRFDPQFFSGATPLDAAARQVAPTYDSGHVLKIIYILFRQYGLSAVQMSGDAYAAYARGWREHPLAMLRFVSTQLREWEAQLAVQPIESVRELILWSTGDDHEFGLELALRQGHWWMMPAVAGRRLGEAASVVVFAAFLLLTPWRVLREGLREPGSRAIAGLWALYLGVAAIQLVVILEPRYLAPVVPWSILVGVANLIWLWKRVPPVMPRQRGARHRGAW